SLVRVEPTDELMPGETEEAGAHPALPGEDRPIQVVEARGARTAGRRDYRSRDDRLVGVLGGKKDGPGAQGGIGNCEKGWIHVESRIEELNISLAVGELVQISVRDRLELAECHSR